MQQAYFLDAWLSFGHLDPVIVVTFYVSHIMCQGSYVTCHESHVMCHMSHVIFLDLRFFRIMLLSFLVEVHI